MARKSDEQLYAELGKRIRKLRKERGWTQVRLAAEANLSRTQPGQLEQGYRKPTLSTLSKITKALGATLEDLFRGL